MANSDLLRSIGTVVQFRKSEVVFMEDDYGDNMYIVLKGKFGVYVNSFVDFPVFVTNIEQGSFFGEMSVIDGWSRSATIIAEEDAAVLDIKNDKFSLLLEKCPDIADSILNTLHTRAESTIEAARCRGKYVPPLPSIFDANDVKSTMDLMISFAHHIRQANSLLYEPHTPPKDNIVLLPNGYTLFNTEDENDNSRMLQEKKVTCPFCLKRSDAYVPFMQNLVQMRSEMDGRIIYKDFNILLYTNIVCPNCNYTDSYREFCKYKPIPEHPVYNNNQFINAEHFTGFSDTHNHTVDEAILSYYLSISCLERVTTDPLRFAKAWIRLYWIYSDLGEQTYSKQAAKMASELYGRYLNKNRGCMPTLDEIRVNAILGELSVAVEDYGQARQYFETNVSLGKNAPEAARELVHASLRRRKEVMELI